MPVKTALTQSRIIFTVSTGDCDAMPPITTFIVGSAVRMPTPGPRRPSWPSYAALSIAAISAGLTYACGIDALSGTVRLEKYGTVKKKCKCGKLHCKC